MNCNSSNIRVAKRRQESYFQKPKKQLTSSNNYDGSVGRKLLYAFHVNQVAHYLKCAYENNSSLSDIVIPMRCAVSAFLCVYTLPRAAEWTETPLCTWLRRFVVNLLHANTCSWVNWYNVHSRIVWFRFIGAVNSPAHVRFECRLSFIDICGFKWTWNSKWHCGFDLNRCTILQLLFNCSQCNVSRIRTIFIFQQTLRSDHQISASSRTQIKLTF